MGIKNSAASISLRSFDSYDKLVIAVGSTSSTHGVPGLEHSFQLKTIADAQAIRRRILGIFPLSFNPLGPSLEAGRQF